MGSAVGLGTTVRLSMLFGGTSMGWVGRSATGGGSLPSSGCRGTSRACSVPELCAAGPSSPPVLWADGCDASTTCAAIDLLDAGAEAVECTSEAATDMGGDGLIGAAPGVAVARR